MSVRMYTFSFGCVCVCTRKFVYRVRAFVRVRVRVRVCVCVCARVCVQPGQGWRFIAETAATAAATGAVQLLLAIGQARAGRVTSHSGQQE